MMNLAEAIQRFDGKHTALLEEISTQVLACEEDSVEALISLSKRDDTKTQAAATWILKWLNEQNVLFPQSQTNDVLHLLCTVSYWEAKLHLLQIFSRLNIPAASCEQLHSTLKEYVCADNKLVRAWSYDALFRLGEQHSHFRDEVKELLNKARHDPAASVKARVRRICKASDWAKS